MVEPQGIVLDDVTFRYPGQEDAVLLNFSTTFSPGRTVALVGEDGIGKSAIVKLPTRLYEPTSGCILLGSVDIQEIEPDAHRDQLAVLFQDLIQYEASLHQNIGFGCLGKLEDGEGILSAARRVRFTDVIEDLPHGIDTQLGKWFSEGRQLSGGEWQRAVLARALFRDAPIIVLDESTTSLDVRVEEVISEQVNVEEVRATKTPISHRLLAVCMADETLVTSEGKLIERDTHSSLAMAGGVHAKVYVTQVKGYPDGQTSSFGWTVVGSMDGDKNLEYGDLSTGGASAGGSLGQSTLCDGCEQALPGLFRRIDSNRKGRALKGFRPISLTSIGVYEA